MTELFSVKWNGEKPAADQQDAAFHRYDTNYFATVTHTKDGVQYELEIHIDGALRLQIPHLNEDGTFDLDNCDYVRYSDDLQRYANTDKELAELFSAWEKRGVDIWVNNPWFDLYAKVDGKVEHLDGVTHEVDEAVSLAKAALEEVAELGGWTNYFSR